jgi:hypothetical protein
VKPRPLIAIATYTVLAVSIFRFPGIAKEQTPPAEPPKLSHVRVVRLSFVQGTVTMRAAGAKQWAKAMVNSPIQQGFSIATAQKSFAEVEFENGSTARLGELSRLDFTELALTAGGDKINYLNFDQGYATFHLLPEHNDDYKVTVGNAMLEPRGKAEFRTDFDQGRLRVEVFNGRVDVAAPHQSERLSKDKVLTFNTAQGQHFDVTHGIQKDEWDQWSMARDQQQSLAYNDQAVSPESSMYGWSDLGTYGDWSYYPGYGYGWAPYEPMGWSPYSMGMWSWYPGMGDTWISGEPWGWLPFHYGMWNFDSGMGWFWQPGFMEAGFSPALVNWYEGGGLIGWGPMGMGGMLPCSMGMAGCIMAMPVDAMYAGQPVGGGGGVARPAPGRMKPIANAPVPLLTQRVLIGRPLPKGLIFPGGPRGSLITSDGLPVPRGAFASRSALPDSKDVSRAASARAPRLRAASGFARGRVAAPSTVVMGKQVSPQSILGRHTSFFSRAFAGTGLEPVRVPLGKTLGGRFPTVAGKNGDLMPRPVMQSVPGRDMARGFGESRSFSRAGGPIVLPRMSSTRASRGFGGGGFYGGGFGGGHMSGISSGPGFSGPSVGAAGHAATAAGGGGHH